MVRKLSLYILIAAALLATPARSAALDREETLDRGLRSDEAYAHSLVLKSNEVEGEKKLALLTEALRHSPDSPTLYFRLARATLPNVGQSAVYLVEGVKAYGRSFWWSTSLKGLSYISLLFSVFLVMLFIVVMRLPSELGRLVHDINERKAKILIPLLLIPAALLGPLVLLGALLILPGLYMRSSDKWVVYLFYILMIAMPVIGGVADTFYSVTSPEIRAMVAVNEGRDNSLALRVLRGKEGFERMFSYATALKREGWPEEAARLFEDMSKKYKDPRVLINLGNALFASRKTSEAKAAYEKAMKMDKSVIVLYNLSQAYRDSFEYAMGDKYYEEAQSIDRQALSEFQQIQGKSYNRTVIDARLTPEEMTHAALEKRRRALPLVGDYKSTALGGVALLVLFAVLDGAIRVRGYRCSKCDSLACDLCSDPNQERDHLCADCLKGQNVGEDTSARARLARMLAANEEKAKRITRIRVLSVAPPGIAQAYSGRVGRSFIFMMFFMYPVVALAMNPYFTTGLGGGSHVWLWVAAVPVMVLDYIVSFITINRRLDRGWL